MNIRSAQRTGEAPAADGQAIIAPTPYMPAVSAWRRTRPTWLTKAVSGAIVACIAALLGVGIGRNAWLALGALGAIGGGLVLCGGRARLVAVVGGGLLSLQSADAFGWAKALYGVAVLLAICGALIHLAMSRDLSRRTRSSGLLWASACVAFVIIASSAWAAANGTEMVMWLRDSAPYFLLAGTPMLALDAATTLREWELRVTFVVASTLATASFVIVWVLRRGLADLALDRLAFPSFLLAAALFCYAITLSLGEGRHRLLWLATAAATFSSLMLTATRSTLVLLVAPLAAIVASRRRKKTARAFIMLPLGAVLIIGVMLGASSLTGIDQSKLTSRLATLALAVTSPTADASSNSRLAQTHVAWTAFTSSLVGGVGPGHEFVWNEEGSPLPKRSYNVDTLMSLPAKFGLLGLGVFALFAIQLVRIVVAKPASSAESTTRVSLIALGVTVACWLPLGNPIEDKGSSMALLLLLALLLKQRQEASHDAALLQSKATSPHAAARDHIGDGRHTGGHVGVRRTRRTAVFATAPSASPLGGGTDVRCQHHRR